jgi:hypothetical protein
LLLEKSRLTLDRTILVAAYHEVLQQRRRDQLSKEFQLQMHQRNATR